MHLEKAARSRIERLSCKTVPFNTHIRGFAFCPYNRVYYTRNAWLMYQ